MERRAVRRYALLVARAAARAAQRAQRAEPHAAAWWDAWSCDERARFFRALAVHSRLRPDCIAHDVGRPVEEVARVLRAFRRHARRVRRLERHTHARRAALVLCPPAHELSPAWLAIEEAGAAALADADDRLACAQEMHAPAAVAGFLRGSGTEPLRAIVDRLVDDTHAELRPTPAYAAYAHTQPLPVLATRDDVARVLEALLVQGRLLAPPDVARPLDAASLHSSAPMTWPDTPGDDAVLDADAVAAFLHRRPHGSAAPYLVPATTDALNYSLRSFVTRVLYEVITVGERAMPPASVDGQHVWAAVARLGALKPDAFRTDMAEAVCEQRTWSEPPVAWMRHVPSEARGRKVPLDVALSSESSSDASDGGEDSEDGEERSVAGSADADADSAGGSPTAGARGEGSGQSAVASVGGRAGRRDIRGGRSASDAGSVAGSVAGSDAGSGAGSDAGSDTQTDASSSSRAASPPRAASSASVASPSPAPSPSPNASFSPDVSPSPDASPSSAASAGAPHPPSALVPPLARTPWRIGAYAPLVPYEYAQVDLGDTGSGTDSGTDSDSASDSASDLGSDASSDSASDSASDTTSDSASDSASDTASDTASDATSVLDRDDQHADAIYEQRLYDWVGLSATDAQSIPP